MYRERSLRVLRVDSVLLQQFKSQTSGDLIPSLEATTTQTQALAMDRPDGVLSAALRSAKSLDLAYTTWENRHAVDIDAMGYM